MPRRQITEREETPTGSPREGYEDFEECQCDDCQEQKERRLASDDWWEEASHRMVEERLENRKTPEEKASTPSLQDFKVRLWTRTPCRS